MSSARRIGLGLLLALAALAPRVGPALRGYQPSNDAAEYLLIARSLAAGEGFSLPIRVRYLQPGPAMHPAWGERAPLWPALLALPVAAGLGQAGWPDPRLQLLGVALAGLAAALGGALTEALARRRGLRGWSRTWAVLAGGLVVAWAPFGVRASIHLWAEPLGLVLTLGALLLWLAHGDAGEAGAGATALAVAAGVLAGLARFARPECWVLVPVLLALAWRRGRRSWLPLGLTLLAVNAAGIGVTGVLAPQLFLLRVAHFEQTMRPDAGAVAQAPGVVAIVGGVARNLLGQLGQLLLPKNAFFVLPLAAWGLRWRGARPLGWAALGLIVATAGVWATADPSRFTIAPLCLLAPVAAVEAEVLRRRFWPGNPWPLAVYLAALAGVLGYAAGRELRRAPPAPPPAVQAREGVAETPDPWSYALLTGRPATLVPE